MSRTICAREWATFQFDGCVLDTKNVTSLNPNWISLSELEKRGYSFSAKLNSGELKVSKGSMVVIKWRRLANNRLTARLFKVQDRLVHEGDDMHVVADDLNYKLWHYRMGHMSDEGLSFLSKRKMIPKKEEKTLLYKGGRKQTQVRYGEGLNY